MNATSAIPQETAIQLCATIQAENKRRWLTPVSMMCRGCVRFSKGDPAKLCFAKRPDNRGCYQVNVRYNHMSRPPCAVPAQQGESWSKVGRWRRLH